MKVVIGERRIGNKQCLDYNHRSLKGGAAAHAAALAETLAEALAGKLEPWASRRVCDRGAASIIDLPQPVLGEYLR